MLCHPQPITGLLFILRVVMPLIAVQVMFVLPVIAQTGISATYSDTWWEDSPSGDYDELAPNQPVVIGYSIGQVDPEFPDQSISVQVSLVSETGRTVTSTASGNSSASVMVAMPLAYEESTQSYEIGNYSIVTTYNSLSGEFTTTSSVGGIGVSISCYSLLFASTVIRTATMTRIQPCNTACGSAGDTLLFRYNPALGPPQMAVVAEPYTKLGSLRICSHATAVRRITGPCQCGNLETPVILPPLIPLPHFGACSSTFASKCMMYGGDYDFETCTCDGCFSCGGSPILIDVNGNGFKLTSADMGVSFDLSSNGLPQKWSWTADDSDDAWLVLDRNGNGAIDDGAEMFGNYTRQPASDNPNGFTALAEFDNFARGGNGDGNIDSQDTVYANLKLWQDKNHNGRSEESELHRLTDLDVDSIALSYKESKMTDAHGNRFVYRSKIKGRRNMTAGRWAYDVFLVQGALRSR